MNSIRFRRVRFEKIYFKQHLCEEFKNSRYPLPNNIRRARNIAIILGWIEIICCFASFGFYDYDRSRIILAMILTTFLATTIGFYAKIKLSWCGLLFHSLYTIPVVGGFYIYVVIDTIMNHGKESKGAMSNTVVLLVSSIPLLGLFLMGIYSCVLLILLDNELAAR